jgi:hypothetical protein
MINKYAGSCAMCGERVGSGSGQLRKQGRRWEVYHLDCFVKSEPSEPQIAYARFSSGAVVYQNKRGRCEDAPCCGCCS